MAALRKPMENNKDEVKDDEDQILKKDVDKVDSFYKDYNEHIERARNFLEFLYVDQWEYNIRQDREKDSRPTMQFNQLVPIIRSILGEQRINSPVLTVRAVGKGATQQDIDIREGLLRQIQYDSDADVIYQIASKQALECGWGAARVLTEYEDEKTFNQRILFKPVVDFQAAFWDPCAQEPDKSDGDFCGVYQIMSKEKFTALYPDIPWPESATNDGYNYYIRWNSRDAIVICELYYKEYFTKTLVQLSDGNELDLEEADEVLNMQEEAMSKDNYQNFMGGDALTEVNRREVQAYRIKHKKFIRNKTLEETDYPGQRLPVPYCEGDSTVIDGERIPLPFIQDGIDQQRLINYTGSEIAYSILRCRKETVMGTAENFEGYEQEWRNPDQVQGPLTYNFDKDAGKPDFVTPPVANPMFIELFGTFVNSLQRSLGWFDEAMGKETNAMSGKAINRRQQASKMPVNVYNDNWARFIKNMGKCALDLFPHVYDTEREIMIMGKDGVSKPITINKRKGFRMKPNGEIEQFIENDMTKGKFEIEIRVDGSYDSQQAEAMDTLIRLATINPAIANLIPDLLAEASGLENSQKLVERLKTLLPPEILAKEDGKPMPPPQQPQIPPEVILQQQKMELGKQQDATKNKQLAIQEQKNMIDAQLAGIQSQTTLAKAEAEIKKAEIGKDVAILNHGNTMRAQHNAQKK